MKGSEKYQKLHRKIAAREWGTSVKVAIPTV